MEVYTQPNGLACLVCVGCFLPCLVCVSDGPVPIADSVGLVGGAKAIFAAASAV